MGKWHTSADETYSRLLLTVEDGWQRYASIYFVEGRWVLMDSPVGVMSSDLETDDLELAQKRALKIVFERVERIYCDIKSLMEIEDAKA